MGERRTAIILERPNVCRNSGDIVRGRAADRTVVCGLNQVVVSGGQAAKTVKDVPGDERVFEIDDAPILVNPISIIVGDRHIIQAGGPASR